MHLLVTDIEWDTDGMPLDECCLPVNVIVLDVPDDIDDEYIDNEVSELLSDAFGFCHQGFLAEKFDNETHAGGGYFPDRLGIIQNK
jgi:hypothetical protein